MSPRRPSHATIVAYVALFFALGGSGWAATHLPGSAGGVSRRQARPAKAKAAPVRVRCTATQGNKRVTCKVVSGSGAGPAGATGPRGLQGLQGPPGASGAAGDDSYTNFPAYAFLEQTPGMTAVSVNGPGSHPLDEYENFAIFNTSGSPVESPPGEPVLQSFVFAPDEMNGSTPHVASVQFCYGMQSNSTDTVAIVGAAMSEYQEIDSTAPSATGTPPGYSTSTLFSQPISGLTGTSAGVSGCDTVTPSTAPAVDPGSLLAFDVTFRYTTTLDDDDSGIQVTLGRITVTYSPS
jgi:hypothetical protein